jgi:hypothetical protein
MKVSFCRKELKKSGQVELEKLVLRLVSKGFGKGYVVGALWGTIEVEEGEDDCTVDVAADEALPVLEWGGAAVEEGVGAEVVSTTSISCRCQSLGIGSGRVSIRIVPLLANSASSRLFRYPTGLIPASDMPHKVASTRRIRKNVVDGVL